MIQISYYSYMYDTFIWAGGEGGVVVAGVMNVNLATHQSYSSFGSSYGAMDHGDVYTFPFSKQSKLPSHAPQCPRLPSSMIITSTYGT